MADDLPHDGTVDFAAVKNVAKNPRADTDLGRQLADQTLYDGLVGLAVFSFLLLGSIRKVQEYICGHDIAGVAPYSHGFVWSQLTKGDLTTPWRRSQSTIWSRFLLCAHCCVAFWASMPLNYLSQTLLLSVLLCAVATFAGVPRRAFTAEAAPLRNGWKLKPWSILGC